MIFHYAIMNNTDLVSGDMWMRIILRGAAVGRLACVGDANMSTWSIVLAGAVQLTDFA